MLHGAQYALLRRELQESGYRKTPLSGGWILFSDPGLPVCYDRERDLLLLGWAGQTRPEGKAPQEEIHALPEDGGEKELLALEETWCGRYLLWRRGCVYTDTCAQLAVYCSGEGISDDCRLLAEGLGLPETLYQPRVGIVMNWMPGPLTHCEGVLKLRPSQVYHMDTGELSGRPLEAPDYQRIPDDDQRIRVFLRFFDTSLRNMQRMLGNRKLLLALTGGYDSRTLFALACHAGIDFEVYTLQYDGIYEGDVSIPGILCERTGKRHHFGKRYGDRFDSELEKEYRRHTSGLILDEDRLFYAHHQYQDLLSACGDAVFLRSSIWENVIEYFSRSFSEDGPGFDFYDWFGVREGSREKKSLEMYFDWERKHPQPGVPASDVFLWEQREGCWLSVIERGFDLLGSGRSFQPCNCRYFLSMLREFPREERLIKHHQARIIAAACPEIADVPFAGDRRVDESLLALLGAKVKRGIHRVRALGLRKTWKTYQTMIRSRLEKRRLHKRMEG